MSAQAPMPTMLEAASTEKGPKGSPSSRDVRSELRAKALTTVLWPRWRFQMRSWMEQPLFIILRRLMLEVVREKSEVGVKVPAVEAAAEAGMEARARPAVPSEVDGARGTEGSESIFSQSASMESSAPLEVAMAKGLATMASKAGPAGR